MLTKTYFPNLNGLRFLGSLVIIILHVEDIKISTGRETVKFIYRYNQSGSLAVSLFFVLSGFLISYLLLKEKESTSTINLKNFYIRRILKIWPLYFLIGIIGFFIFPVLNDYWHLNCFIYNDKYLWLKIILYFLFIPPWVESKVIGPTWSVRVEEVFYLFWPLLLNRFKNPMKLFVSVAVFVILIRNVSDYLSQTFTDHTVFKILFHYTLTYRVSCMAIGAIGAYYIVKENRRVLSVIYRKDFQWALYILTGVLLLLRVHVRFIHVEFYSVLFICILVNLACNPHSILNFDYKWMSYLGKVSYGLYVYNSITRILCLRFTEYLFGREMSGLPMETVLYALTLSSTILTAILSYEFFEKPFLRLKHKFEDIGQIKIYPRLRMLSKQPKEN